MRLGVVFFADVDSFRHTAAESRRLTRGSRARRDAAENEALREHREETKAARTARSMTPVEGRTNSGAFTGASSQSTYHRYHVTIGQWLVHDRMCVWVVHACVYGWVYEQMERSKAKMCLL